MSKFALPDLIREQYNRNIRILLNPKDEGLKDLIKNDLLKKNRG